MNVILLSLAVAGAVWGAVLLLRGSLVAGCLAYFLLLTCFGRNFLQFDVGGITLSLDRLFLVFLVGSYAVQWRLGRIRYKPLEKLDWLVLGFVGLLTASTAVGKVFGAETPVDPANPDAASIVQHLINGYLIPLSLYWIARQSPLSERALAGVLGFLTVFGIYLAATGLAEFFGQWALVFPRYIADPKIGLHFGRARGPMVQSVSYGFCLGACWLASWLWRERLGRAGQLAILAASPLFAAAVFCSHTRSVWIGVGLSVLVVLGLTLRGAWRPLALAALVVGGCVLVLPNLERIVSLERGDNSASQTRDSANFRKSFAYVSWRMFQDSPFLGVGFGQFTMAKLPYIHDRGVDLRLEPIRDWSHHNTYLSLLTEVGAIGLALFLALLAGWTRRAWRLARDPASSPAARRQGMLLLATLGIYIVQAMCHELSFSPIDNSLLFLMAGLAVGLGRPASPATAPALRTATPIEREAPLPVGAR